MELLIAVMLGYVLGSTAPKKLKAKVYAISGKIYKYFSSPSNNKLEFNWSTSKLIALFSNHASQRWYEARAHLYQGVFKSLVCTFGLIHLVRIYLIDNEESRGVSKTFIFHGFQSLEKILEKTEAVKTNYLYSHNNNLPVKDRLFYYQTFVAGHNVVEDFMNGVFVK